LGENNRQRKKKTQKYNNRRTTILFPVLMAYQHDTRRPESHNPKREVPYLVRWERKRYLKTTTTTPMLFFVFSKPPLLCVYLEELVEAKGAMLMTLAEETLFWFEFDAKHWRLLNCCCLVVAGKRQQLLLLDGCRDGRRQKCAIRAHNHVADGS
jgi:hypothetical protein